MNIENWDWLKIRLINNSQRDGFEKFVSQLARKEGIDNAKFYSLGNPDGGIECYWELNDGKIIGWQAKFFLHSFNSSQWKQIFKSFKSSLENYDNLTKWIVAVPYAPSNVLLDKYKVKIEELQNFAKSKGKNIIVEFWWADDLIDKCRQQCSEGFIKFWFNDLEFTNDWFKEKVDDCLCNINEYISDLNIKTDNIKYFNAISRNQDFINYFSKQLNKYLCDIDNGYELFKDFLNNNYEDTLRDKLVENFQAFTKELNFCQGFDKSLDFRNMDEYLDFDKIIDSLNNMESILDLIKKMDERSSSDNFYSYYNSLISSIHILKSFLCSDEIKLINNPFLVFYGESGIGKSFLFADVAKNKIENNENIILLLGNHFGQDKNPERIILEELDISSNYNFNDFLDALEYKAQIQESRIIIMIDAINEGKGVDYWNTYFKSFINKISRRKWLGCVVSIRDNYMDEFNYDSNLITEIKIHGFDNVNIAVQKYFEYYKIQLDLNCFRYEFTNPLFLNLFCQSIVNNNYNIVPSDLEGFSNFINFYISSLNKKLRKKLNCPFIIKVDLILESIVNMKNELNHYLTVDETIEIIKNILSENRIFAAKVLYELINEGILNKFNNNGIESISISFQKLEDFLLVKSLLNGLSVENLYEEFSIDGNLFKFVDLNNSPNYQLIEMFSIYIPEIYGVELYELLNDDFKNDEIIVNYLINSLRWRNESISNNVKEYINENVLKKSICFNDFFETLILVAPIENHLFNANYLHELLFKQELKNRDGFWLEFIRYNKYILNQVLSLAFSIKDSTFNNNDESVKLFSILISWFLATTNLKLRDCSTRALINLLKDNINILIELLKSFENVNDPYIYERVYAVAYGCALLTSDLDSLIKLSNYIYKTIFDKEYVYPNILLRDYARNIIEFSLLKGLDLDINLEKIRPPYKSIFPKIPSDDEIKKLNNGHSAIYKIFSSMEVEHTRDGKVAFYGDFGRYIFQSALSLWDSKLSQDNISYVDLKNIAIKRIFNLGYDLDLHGSYDESIINYNYGLEERVGKKYQWIVLLELLAQVSDKYKFVDKDYICDDNEILYRGPWQEFLRNVDPTIIKHYSLDYKIPKFDEFYQQDNNYQSGEWIKSYIDLPNPKELIDINIPCIEFNGFLLNGDLKWESTTKCEEYKYRNSRKYLAYEFDSFIVKKEDFNKIKAYLKYKNLDEFRIFRNVEYHELFNKEIYQSQPFNYFYNNRVNEKSNILIDNNEYDVEETTIRVVSTENDTLKNKSFLRVNKNIFDNLNISYGDYNSFLYIDDSIVGLDTSELGFSSNFLFDKNILINYLEENNLRIFFTCVGRKMILGNLEPYNQNNYLNFNGAYYLENDKIRLISCNFYYKVYYDCLRTSLVGIIEKLDDFEDEPNNEYYWDNKNNIIYKFFKLQNLEEITFEKKIYDSKKINNIKWNIYSVSKVKELLNDNIKIKDLLSNNGYLFVTNQSDSLYAILIVGDNKFDSSYDDLRSNLYKNYIKYLLENMEIIPQYSNNFDINILKKLVENNITED